MAEKQSNVVKLTRGFQYLLQGMAPYIASELLAAYGDDWWQRAVLDRLYADQKRDLPGSGDYETLVNSLDIQRCLILFDIYWNDIFRGLLSQDYRTWAKELMGVRNRHAHIGSEDFNAADTWRGLDTMARLCEAMNADRAEDIRAILDGSRPEFSHGQNERDLPNTSPIPNADKLPSWREIIEPHPDVAEGRYKNAEFAADLAQVARGEGAFEYLDPVEFFKRTFITVGMKGLLGEALERVSGKGGEPVIQLKTAFGGGKTHSMLALYHLLRGNAPLEEIPSIRPILDELGLAALPQTHVAVLVGTSLDPTRGRRPANFPGITVNTLWGELALQLALSTGKKELYEIAREADKKGISPGSATLQNLLDAAGSTLVLIDELVAYARKIYGAKGLPAGSFDNFITFVQELGEAARASKTSLVVASIPESDVEIGGEAGRKALEAIEHTFGRLESIWKPVAANEGFEVVRRRLFLDCKDPKGRDMVCARFGEMYSQNPADFPLEAREADYRRRLRACYPIHPEVFDRLYEDWATLERFQRTRGVLRLMAAVIHELWMGKDQGAFIQPGSLPLDTPAVRDELTRRLDDSWNAIVDREVDGKNSAPFLQDKGTSRYGKLAASRRVARTIMLGSAPTARQQRVRGLEASRIRLGVAQPGESISTFNDALSALRNNLAYLYSNPTGDRFWYDTRPTLRKTVEERAGQIAQADVDFEIQRRLKIQCKKIAPLAGVHACPASSQDVPDEPAARLVILRDFYDPQNRGCPALRVGREMLKNHGNGPRAHRNMLVFVAPDKTVLASLERETRRYLAWQSIRNDSQDLNLDMAQTRETENSLSRGNQAVNTRLDEAFCWLLAPSEDRVDLDKTEWQDARLSGSGGIVGKAVKKLLEEEALVEKWAPAPLLMELDNALWRDREGEEKKGIEVKRLWECLTKYCYLPRLADYAVLAAAIRAGAKNSDQYFAYAAGYDGERFIDLKYSQEIELETGGWLVKRAVAKKQIEEDERARGKDPGNDGDDKPGGDHYPGGGESGGDGGVGEGRTNPTPPNPTPPKPAPPKHFTLSANLDSTRIIKQVHDLLDEVINNIADQVAKNGSLEISLNIEAHKEDGFDQQTVRAVLENCATLKLGDGNFYDTGKGD